MFLTGATQRGYPVLATCSSCHVFCSCHLVFLSVLALEMRLADLVLASGQGSSDQMFTFFNLSSAADSVAIQLALRGKTITGLTKRALKVNIAGPAPPRYDPATKHGSRAKWQICGTTCGTDTHILRDIETKAERCTEIHGEAILSGCSSSCESCSEGGFGGFDESVGRAWPNASH